MGAAPEVLFSTHRIAIRVRELGEAIRERYGDQPLTVLSILKGALLFTADLVRVLGEPSELTFVRARSYGRGKTSSGTVRLSALEEDVIRDRIVIVTDTILDTGRTLRAVVDAVRRLGAAEVAACVFLDKPARRQIDIVPDWVGFEVEDRFLVGYGLDYAGRYRALPYIAALESDTRG